MQTTRARITEADRCLRFSGIPPTELVDSSYSAYTGRAAGRISGIPPTELVDGSYSALSLAQFGLVGGIAHSKSSVYGPFCVGWK